MIASIDKGRGAGGAVAYALDERGTRGKEARIVANTTSGRTGREITQEFDALAALRPDVGRKTFFGSLSAAPGEHLNDAQWGKIGRVWARHHGFRTYVAVVHRGGAQEHIHLIASRVGVDGRVVSDRFDYYEAQTYARHVERKYRLERVASSWEVGKHGVERAEPRTSRGAAEWAAREGREEPLAEVARREFAGALAEATGWADAHARAAARGYTIAPGRRGPGLTLSDGRETMKLSDVGRAYSRGQLEQRWGTYERAVERITERAPEREPDRREQRDEQRDEQREQGSGERHAAPATGRERDRVPAAPERGESPAGAAATGPAVGRAPGRRPEPGRADVGGGAAHAPAAGDPARGDAGRIAERGGPGDRRGPGVYDSGGRDADGHRRVAAGEGTGRNGAPELGGRGERGRAADRAADGPGRGAGGQDLGGRGAERGEGGSRRAIGAVAGVADGRGGPDVPPPGVRTPGVGGPAVPGDGGGAADDPGAAVRSGAGGGLARGLPRPEDDQARSVPDRGVHGAPNARGVPAPAAGERDAGPVTDPVTGPVVGPAADAARAAFYADLHATLRAQLGAAHAAARPAVGHSSQLGAEGGAEAPPQVGPERQSFRLRPSEAPEELEAASELAPEAVREQVREPRSVWRGPDADGGQQLPPRRRSRGR